LAQEIGLPVLVRPSYVLGGRAMVIAYDLTTVEAYAKMATELGRSARLATSARPILIDQFLERATEVDVDALCDGEDVLIGGIMEHIEEAGIHSGDSSCVLPPVSLGAKQLADLRSYTVRLARALRVVGLMNVQYAIQNGKVFVLEVNPRASRTVPFVSKATGYPLAKIAARLMTGRKLKELALAGPAMGGAGGELPTKDYFSVKSPVFPFAKFRGVDTILGPEMRSTGEVMGIASSFGSAFAKAQLGAGHKLPLPARNGGTVFVSVNDADKPAAVRIIRDLGKLGFRVVATRGTAGALERAGIFAEVIFKVNEGRPNVVDWIRNGRIYLIINTPLGSESFFDEKAIRRAAVRHSIPCITTLSAARAAVAGIAAMAEPELEIASLQELQALNRHGSSDARARRDTLATASSSPENS
jgi:carbamoyl-phosphate synthase large subunit